MTDDLASLPAVLKAPIPGPSPSGEDVTYDPVFERLRETVDRLDSVGTAVDHESVSAGGPFASAASTDHDAVVADALTVLTEQSKDIRAAAYLVTSLARTAGAPGVAAGLMGLAEMTQAHWSGLHPSRPRARRGAFEFLAARVSAALATWDRPAADEREPLDAALTALADLQILVSAEMGDDAPALSGLRRALADRLRAVPDEAPAPPADQPAPPAAGSDPTQGDGSPTASAPPPAAPTARPPASAPRPPAPSGPAPAVAFTGDPVRAVVQAAAAFRAAEAGSPSAIRLLRIVRWDPIVAPPPATDGTTMIEPPPDRRREALVALAASDPALFVEQAEQALADASFHVWLDLQRLADGALATLGPTGAGGRAALRAEVGRLAGRVPSLVDLRFRDGTPFADDATRAWALGLSASPPASSPRPPSAGAGAGDALDDALGTARSLVAEGDLAGALAALERTTPPGGRAGLVHRLRTAELCLTAGRADVAHALLAALVRSADGQGLDTWEPELAADLYATLARAARQAGQAEAAAQADDRLAAVAPSRAVANG